MTQRIRIFFGLFVGLAGSLILILLFNATSETEVQNSISVCDLQAISPGTLITDVGRYSVGDDRFLDIRGREPNEIVIRVFSRPKTGCQISETDWTFHTGTRFNEEWYVSIDQYNRIWIYVGASTQGRDIPSVYLDGYSFDSGGRVCHMTEEISRTGRWDGVPEKFLSRLQESPLAFSGTIPKISPPLPEHQQTQLAMMSQTRR